MFNAFGQNSEREDLRFRECLLSIGAIGQDARQLRHFREPATVILTLRLNAQLHGATLT